MTTTDLSGGLCWGSDTPDAWYPTSNQPEVNDQATHLCDGCPVLHDCLNEAMRTENDTNRHGIWGGTTPTQRALLARARTGRRSS